jgi:hypothetical protein
VIVSLGTSGLLTPYFGLLQQQFGGHMFHNTAEMGMDVRERGECGGYKFYHNRLFKHMARG